MTENGNGDVPVTELPPNERPQSEYDLGAEFTELGEQFRRVFKAAWESQERKDIQDEIRDGLNNLAEEINKAAKNVRDTDTAQKVESNLKNVRADVQSGKVADDMRGGLAKALRGLRDALDDLADRFTPVDEVADK